MSKIYMDNAATTPMDEEVVNEMANLMRNSFGNPSSIHALGREARTHIEKSRKKIAEYLHCSPAEIFFTSGGTEADNMALRCAVDDLGVKRIITTTIEHHAVSHTVEDLWHRNKIRIQFVNVNEKGFIDIHHLETLLQEEEAPALVSLMHANNEIGTMINIVEVGNLCRKYNAYFHSDTVQTMGHYTIDLKEIPIDFITCSAHKFHGPKGIGFLYINSNVKIKPLLTGGSQERNMRAGTENIYGIIGLAKAMEVALRDLDAHQKHVREIKNYMIKKLREEIPGVDFNGDISDNSLYTVLNVKFPPTPDSEMFLMKLDIMGICASGGSACSSGSNVGSHVLAGIKCAGDRPSIRFSFSKYNTLEEVDKVVSVLKGMFEPQIA
jgi:cysteine desulfurase